ncbi:DUF3618 domain-containing protein [Pseudonocardiaceae bacterium YIM PH 21723]|nr:DUF3618 domain-containing protein [Pseudonocardiaceae bacterium YIM PH 21723]
MARDHETIEREIQQARAALTDTLDEIGRRANPTKLVDESKASLGETLRNPKVKYPLIGFGALIVLVLLRKLFR